MRRLARFVCAALLLAVSAAAATYYLSPSGNDAASGVHPPFAWKSFERAFAAMQAGDELILLPGVYSEQAGTGYISYLGGKSAQPPSGIGLDRPTRVRALRPGRVWIAGQLWLGRSKAKCRYVAIDGIDFEGGGVLYNTSFVAIRNSGFHDLSEGGGAVFGIGTNDGDWGNTDNLIEDVWIWGRDRIIAANYRADRNVWRRVVVRGDGCASAECTGSGNPNVGITVYDSANVSLQNVMVLDRVLAGGTPYADFATAEHTAGRAFGNNEWLGAISLNSADACFNLEADETSLNLPAWRLHNVVGWNCQGLGLNASGPADSATELLNGTFRVMGAGSIALRIPAGGAPGAIARVIVTGAGRIGTNVGTAFQDFDESGQWSEALDYAARCATGCLTSDPLADGQPPSLGYILRIEDGSVLDGAAEGEDIGATVVHRYGVDGTFYGQPGYKDLTDVPLWPWPNESRIRGDLCASETRGFCAAASLTGYLWTQLGNPVPPDIVPPPSHHPSPIRLPFPVPEPPRRFQ